MCVENRSYYCSLVSKRCSIFPQESCPKSSVSGPSKWHLPVARTENPCPFSRILTNFHIPQISNSSNRPNLFFKHCRNLQMFRMCKKRSIPSISCPFSPNKNLGVITLKYVLQCFIDRGFPKTRGGHRSR